ncbi:MAG: UDP-N-acetylglucosamine 2-epimerase (non-hydrolyzing) [Blastocatellia bacterium]
MSRRKIVSIVGTRPEVIKMAPVIRELERRRSDFDHTIVATAQHRQMLDQVLAAFGIEPDIDLGLMQQNQDLAEFASRSLLSLSNLFAQLKPDVVLVQGDTTTVMTAALAAFYKGIQVGHVEAGLRSFDRYQPFPEEINRRVAGCLASMHFAPTPRARLNLLREGVPDDSIFVTGNTIVDALLSISLEAGYDNASLAGVGENGNRVMLVTAHRRENHGEPLRSICRALKTLTSTFADLEVVYPVHLNPSVRTLVREELDKIDRIHLVDPVSYPDLLRLMRRCYLILTDSGGIQEEAPSFHKPVLVLRELTERPELIESNAGKIVGTDTQRVVDAATSLLRDQAEYTRMAAAENPFGDGHAAERIADILAGILPLPEVLDGAQS